MDPEDDELLDRLRRSREFQCQMHRWWGTLAGQRRCLVQVGTRTFGPPGAAVLAALELVAFPDHLDDLANRLLDSNTWEELLARDCPALLNSAEGRT